MFSQYSLTDLLNIIPFAFSYTEMHHRFSFIGSRYYKKEPEIIVDIPHRIDPNHDIPILLLVKDSHEHPVKIIDVNIEISLKNEKLKEKININNSVNQRWWHKVYVIKRPKITG